MKKKDSKNYLDFVPEKNPEIEYEADEDGIITVLIEWKGFYHKIAQKLFRRPRVSDIRLDELGSFVWNAVDGKKGCPSDFQRTRTAVSENGKACSPSDQIPRNTTR